MASLSSPNHPSVRALVAQLSVVVPPSSLDGKSAGIGCTSHKSVSLVQEYDPELDRRCRLHNSPKNETWRVDET